MSPLILALLSLAASQSVGNALTLDGTEATALTLDGSAGSALTI